MARRREQSLASIFNDLRADFRAGKDTRFVSKLTGVSSSGSGADYHYRNERQFLHMLERARHYQRNDPIVGQGVRRLVANVVQDGFRVDPQTGDAGLDRDLKAEWMNWAEDADACHSEGELTFGEMESLALSAIFVDGDILALPLKSGSLQFVEAHRLRTPRNTSRNVVHGVLLDDSARRREYWITKEDLNPHRALTRVSDIKPYEARDRSTGCRQVLHLYMPDRFSQRRGVTALAPISDTVGMHDDLQFSTLVKAQMSALIAILRERSVDWEPSGYDAQKGARTTESVNGYTRTIEGVSAGLEIAGEPGEVFKGFSPQVPSPEFFPHANLILTFIAINLDMPVHVLLLDPSNTNFSGWRGAIDQARLRFKQIQTQFCARFHRPVYRWRIDQLIARNPAIRRASQRSDVRIYGHRWNPPQFPYIEPLKDASADLLQQRNGLNSPRRIQAARGRDWDEISTEIIEDNKSAIVKAIKAATEINDEYDAGVHWRELVSLPTPDGVQVSLSGDEPSQTSNGKPANGVPQNRLQGLLGGRNGN